METDKSPSEHPAQRPTRPGMPTRHVTPVGRPRPMVDGFAPRRPAGAPSTNLHPVNPSTPDHIQPAPVLNKPTTPTPEVTATPAPVAVRPPNATPHPTPQPSQAQPAQPQPVASSQAGPNITSTRPADTFTSASSRPLDTDLPLAGADRLQKESSQTGRAWLAGLVVFIVLGALFISPFLPGKITQNLPLSSQTFSTGDQTLSCIGTQGQIHSANEYNSKAGSPINYSYTTTTTQSATCNGSMQTATTGSSSQFAPLGLVIDVAVAFIVALIVSKIWGYVYRRRH